MTKEELEKEGRIKDIFSDEELKTEFLGVIEKGRTKRFVQYGNHDISEDKRKDFFKTRLYKVFLARCRSILIKMRNGEVTNADLYRERMIWDIIGLQYAGFIQLNNGDFLEKFESLIKLKLKKSIPDYIKSRIGTAIKDGSIIEDETELDQMLGFILLDKIERGGCMRLKYSNFILRQCFSSNSAIQKNKEKYREVVYRALEDYTKRKNIEKAIGREYSIQRKVKRILSQSFDLEKEGEEELKYHDINPSEKPEGGVKKALREGDTLVEDFIKTIKIIQNIEIDENISQYKKSSENMAPKIESSRDREFSQYLDENRIDSFNYIDLIKGYTEQIKVVELLNYLMSVGWGFTKETIELLEKLHDSSKIDEKMRKFLELVLSNISYIDESNNYPLVSIEDLDDECGMHTRGHITIGERHIMDLLYGTNQDKLEVIDTASHEGAHEKQHKSYLGHPDSYLRYIQLKIDIAFRTDKLDIKAIYENEDLRELEARAEGAQKAIEFAEKNQLDIDLSKERRIVERYTNMIQSLLYHKESITTPEGEKHRIVTLSELVKKGLIEELEFFKRENISDDDLEELVLKNAIQKYRKNPEKEIEVDDFCPNLHPLSENYILRIEYHDDGTRRNFSNFLLNVKSILCHHRILNASKRVPYWVDKKMADLIKDIAIYEYIKVGNLDEILDGLMNELVQYDGQPSPSESVLFKGFVKEITAETMAEKFAEAKEKLKYVNPNETRELLEKCKIIHMLDEAHDEKRKEFLDGMHIIDEKYGKSPFEMMEEFEEEAYKVLRRKDSSSRNEGNKPGSTNPFDDGPSMDD